MGSSIRRRNLYNLSLLGVSVFFIFFLGIIELGGNRQFVYKVVISFIYIFSFLTIKEESALSLSIPSVMVILTWIGFIFHLPVFTRITGIISTFFFFVVTILLMLRIARSSKVGVLEFVEAVNIYILLGIAASVLFRSVYAFNPHAYNTPPGGLSGMSDFIYFAFVTVSTLGYGDISPASPAARSLAIFFSVSGQLYLTMIIALLVGKYLSEKTNR